MHKIFKNDPHALFPPSHPRGSDLPAAGVHWGGDLETGYRVMYRVEGITILDCELWSKYRRPPWGIFDFSRINYEKFLALNRLKSISI